MLPLDWQLQGCLTASSQALNSFGCPQMHQLTSVHPIILKLGLNLPNLSNVLIGFFSLEPILIGKPQEFSSSLGASCHCRQGSKGGLSWKRSKGRKALRPEVLRAPNIGGRLSWRLKAGRDRCTACTVTPVMKLWPG